MPSREIKTPRLYSFLGIVIASFFLTFYFAPPGSILKAGKVASPSPITSASTLVIADRAYIASGLLGLLAFFICLLYLRRYYRKELAKYNRNHERRIEELEEHAGLTNPNKN
jgi:hypothetical protein